MEERKSFSSYSLFFKTIAVILVMAMMANFTLTAYAAESQKLYVREVIIVTANSLDEANQKAKEASEKTKNTGEKGKERDYIVFDQPIYVSDQTKTWLCYATTTNPNLAVTSIKTMNMTGGWSYEEYDKYLDELWNKASRLVEDMMIAVREYNKNVAANYSRTLYAKSILDLMYEDDSKKTVSEFFKDMGTEPYKDTAKEKECTEKMTKFVLEANTNLLYSIQNALMLSCADTYKYDNRNYYGDSIFDGLEWQLFLNGINGMKQNPEKYSYYDTYVDDILNSLPEAQKALFFYTKSGKYQYTPEMEEMAEIAEEIAIQNGKDAQMTDEEIIEGLNDSVAEILDIVVGEGEFDGMEFSEEQRDAAWALLCYHNYYNGLSEEDQILYTNGRMLFAAFYECKYTGYYVDSDREYDNLFYLMTKYDLNDPDCPKNNYEKSDFYPIIDMMTPGQRAMLKVGLTQFVGAVVLGTEVLENNKAITLTQLNEQVEDGAEKIKDGDTVSVYYGVDRSLFIKDSGIAMTSDAIKACKEKPLSPEQAYYKKMEQISTYTMIASGVSAAAMTAATIGCVIKMQVGFSTLSTGQAGLSATRVLYGVMASIQNSSTQGTTQYLFNAAGNKMLVKLGSVSTKKCVANFGNCLKAFITSGGLGTVLTVVNVVSIAVFLISLLIKLVSAEKAKAADTPYIDIPRVMCSYEPLFDVNADGGLSNQKDYIYYYGVKNPCLTQQDKTRAANVGDTNGIFTDILKFGIGDVANWTLHGADREWVALYAANDKRAGNPILAGKFAVLTDSSKIASGYVSVKKFNTGAAYDLQTYYSITQRSSAVGARYLCYQMERSTSTQGASVFSVASPIGMLIVGAVAGGGLGTLITYFATKKRKKSQIVKG